MPDEDEEPMIVDDARGFTAHSNHEKLRCFLFTAQWLCVCFVGFEFGFAGTGLLGSQ